MPCAPFSQPNFCRQLSELGRFDPFRLAPLECGVRLPYVKESPLRLLRESLELDQKDFAESIGVTQARISQVEAGQGNLSTSRLYQVMDDYRQQIRRLDLRVEDFLRGTTERKSA